MLQTEEEFITILKNAPLEYLRLSSAVRVYSSFAIFQNMVKLGNLNVEYFKIPFKFK